MAVRDDLDAESGVDQDEQDPAAEATPGEAERGVATTPTAAARKGKKKPLTRETELIDERGKAGEELKKKVVKAYADIEEGFIKQAQRSDDQIDNWDCYNCVLGGYQAYSGNAQIYVPIIHNALNARATRFTNQLFPKGGRYVDVVSTDADQPNALVALAEHYVRKARLRTEVAPALVVNGDTEGQYNVYVSWSSQARHVTWKEKRPVTVEGAQIPGLDDEIEDIVKDVILDEHPVVEVLPDSDVLILPTTANSVTEALAIGGSVTVIRRWTKGQLEKMVDDGDIVEDEGLSCVEQMGAGGARQGHTDAKKNHADAAGIQAKGSLCLGYETWKVYKIAGEDRLCKTLYGGSDMILSCRLNPFWSDRCPVISVPVKKVSGVIKGIPPVEACTRLQYAANDAINEGMDSATYSLLPIIMTDPLKNPKTNTMILDLAAVWETNPNDTKFAVFPQLYKEAFEIVGACQGQIFQTLSVTPAMMPQSTGGRNKRNQAEIAQEQQVDILSTSDAVTVLEEGVFTPILERFMEMDHQFRTTDITIRAFGHMGMRAEMEQVPPIQIGTRYNFVWYGVEQARDAAAKQQQIALINVIRGTPPELLRGRRLNMVPVIDAAVASTFSSRIAPYIWEDLTKQFSYPAEQENWILQEGHLWPISPLDDDTKHMEVHQQAVQESGDTHGTLKQHIAQHRMSQIQKAMAQQQSQGTPGTPGGDRPGIAGTPRPGAQPANVRQLKQAPGAIAPDRMGAAGAVVPPRRA